MDRKQVLAAIKIVNELLPKDKKISFFLKQDALEATFLKSIEDLDEGVLKSIEKRVPVDYKLLVTVQNALVDEEEARHQDKLSQSKESEVTTKPAKEPKAKKEPDGLPYREGSGARRIYEALYVSGKSGLSAAGLVGNIDIVSSNPEGRAKHILGELVRDGFASKKEGRYFISADAK